MVSIVLFEVFRNKTKEYLRAEFLHYLKTILF